MGEPAIRTGTVPESLKRTNLLKIAHEIIKRSNPETIFTMKLRSKKGPLKPVEIINVTRLKGDRNVGTPIENSGNRRNKIIVISETEDAAVPLFRVTEKNKVRFERKNMYEMSVK